MNKPTQEAIKALDEFFNGKKSEGNELHYRRLRAIIRAYGERWANDVNNYSVLAVEELMLAPIKSLESGKDSGFVAGGKIDGVIQEKIGSNNLIVLDHKFLSSAFTPEKAEHLIIDGQPSQYAYLCWSEGIKVTHVLWDSIVKSLHRKGGSETWQGFEDRVFEVYREDKDRFARHKVPIIKENVVEYLDELYDWAKEIGLEAKGSKHLKSRGNCFEYNSPCSYLGVCTGFSDPNDSSKWKIVGTEHAELELPEGTSPFKVLTNSRVKTYQSCRQKHHYRYNMGLQKIEENKSEPLFVGSAGHMALEAYWQAVAKGVS